MTVVIVIVLPIRQSETKSVPRRNRVPLDNQPLLQEGAEYVTHIRDTHCQSNIVVTPRRLADRAFASVSGS